MTCSYIQDENTQRGTMLLVTVLQKRPGKNSRGLVANVMYYSLKRLGLVNQS